MKKIIFLALMGMLTLRTGKADHNALFRFFQAGFITRRTQKCHAGTGKENNIPAYR